MRSDRDATTFAPVADTAERTSFGRVGAPNSGWMDAPMHDDDGG